MRMAWLPVVLLSWGSVAEAIPAFARRYSASCAMCHNPPPRLNAMGELVAANGFQLAPKEPPRDAVETGDPLLQLLQQVPLAIRIDGYLAAESALRDPPSPSVDFQVPWVMKLLSGGVIAPNVSYYLYFLLAERGEVAGLEDAFLQFSDVFGSGVNLIVGQFQVSDPLFKRELRLPYEDYQPYRVRAGVVHADLTYDRGLMASWSPPWWKGGDLTVELVSGRGLNAASEARQFDGDLWKNVAARYSQQLGAKARLGLFGYAGAESSEGIRDRILVFGPDLTLTFGKLELNAQALRRLDSNPLLEAGGGATRIDSLMVELLYGPFRNDRWYLAGLYSFIDANAPVLSLRLGESPGYLRRYHAVSLGVHYLLRRNIRLVGEARWDLQAQRARLVAGTSLAF